MTGVRPYYTKAQAAERLGIGVGLVDELVKEGVLKRLVRKGEANGKSWMIFGWSVEDLRRQGLAHYDAEHATVDTERSEVGAR